MAETKAPPAVVGGAGKIHVTGKGEKDEQIQIVVKNADNQIVHDSTFTLPDDAAHTLDIALSAGKYEVRVTAKIGGAPQVIYDQEVIVT